jgi:hypothetical protein
MFFGGLDQAAKQTEGLSSNYILMANGAEGMGSWRLLVAEFLFVARVSDRFLVSKYPISLNHWFLSMSLFGCNRGHIPFYIDFLYR